MTRREVIGRYRGSMLGLAWSFFNPLIMLVIYTFVFSLVFKVRWHTGSDSKTEFALALFIGMIVHALLAESITRAPATIIGNVNYVKKVVFPLEILAWVNMGATLFHTLVSLLVWALFFILIHRTLNWTVIFLPLVLMPLVFFAMGASWFLSSLGVYLRDVGQVTGMLSTILMFLAPVFYPLSALPERFRAVLYANPLTFFIEQSRDVLMWGRLPDWGGLALATVLGLIFAWMGFAWFQKTRGGFADVL